MVKVGGWYHKNRLLELLAQAEETLFHDGHEFQSDAVEQAIVIIQNLPRGAMISPLSEKIRKGQCTVEEYREMIGVTMANCRKHEFVREPDAPRGYACAHCHCTPPDDWYPESPDIDSL